MSHCRILLFYLFYKNKYNIDLSKDLENFPFGFIRYQHQAIRTRFKKSINRSAL